MTRKWKAAFTNLLYVLAYSLVIILYGIFLIAPVVLSPRFYSLTYESTAKVTSVYYLHRTDLSGVTPAGKLMNATRPPSNQSEITYVLGRGWSVYYYTPMLPSASIENRTWTLNLWASTASSTGGKLSHLTVQIHVVSSNGTTERATLGTITDVVIDYGYSERIITMSGNSANVTSGDRIRLTLTAQSGAQDDPAGMSFYYDGYGAYQTTNHETRLETP
jgi:hypothetical protein